MPIIDELPFVLRARAGTAALDVARLIAIDASGLEPVILDARLLDLDGSERAAGEDSNPERVEVVRGHRVKPRGAVGWPR